MTTLRLAGHVEEAFPVEQDPAQAYAYFAQNENLLRQFLGPERVETLGDGLYRVKVNPHGAMGLTLRPVFDVRFVECPPDRVEMRSEGCRLLESSFGETGFEASFSGEARFMPHELGCLVDCWADMIVYLQVPDVLAWMPIHLLESLGNGVIHAAMHGLAKRIVPLMQADIMAWAASRAEA